MTREQERDHDWDCLQNAEASARFYINKSEHSGKPLTNTQKKTINFCIDEIDRILAKWPEFGDKEGRNFSPDARLQNGKFEIEDLKVAR
jgi:hypothetical protein